MSNPYRVARSATTILGAVLVTVCSAPRPDAAARDGSPDDVAVEGEPGPPAAPDAPDSLVQRFAAAVYGASGVAPLPDGRVVIAEDEKRHPLDVVDLTPAHADIALTPRDVERAFSASGVTALNDLEGITANGRGRLYAVTSHALTPTGARKADREWLVRSR